MGENVFRKFYDSSIFFMSDEIIRDSVLSSHLHSGLALRGLATCIVLVK